MSQITFDFHSLDNNEIASILREHQIPLTSEEARQIQNLLKCAPTLAECILWSIQASEHCSYKSTRMHLQSLPTSAPNVILGPKEDAGIVAVATDNQGQRYGVVMSHESHNHPSQVVPYEGAATGVGGNVRDVSCMGADVIAIADSLRFGDIKQHKSRWIHEGVVAGIAGYGNPIGVPNIAGDLFYDQAYRDNCLVTVVTLGVVKESDIIHSYAPENADGYDLILVGKPTDNSGFGGASFASLELDEDNEDKNRGAVQEPNAFLGRHLLAANSALFKQLKQKNALNKVGFKDLGAGGIACASVELAEASGYGADVFLENVHTAYENLNSTVILCAETQERYMWVCHPDLSEFILNHYNNIYALPEVSKGAKASKIGKITGTGKYRVLHNDDIVIDAKASDITQGIQYQREHYKKQVSLQEPELDVEKLNAQKVLLELLAHENIACRKPVYESYDKQVQGRTVIERGQAAAGVLQPFNNEDYPEEIRTTGVSLVTAHNPAYGKINAYWAAINAVVLATLKTAATGADPQAITDCLCFGNPEKPEQMQEFVDAVAGIKIACETIGLKSHPESPLPVIAGNVSLYNESKQQAIPASPIIACLGNLQQASHAIGHSLQKQDSFILLLGDRKPELGGSAFYQSQGYLGADLPQPDLAVVKTYISLLVDAIERRLILAASVIDAGGLAVTLAKMAFKNNIGFDVALKNEYSEAVNLFSESPGVVFEVAEENLPMLNEILMTHDLSIQVLGRTNSQHRLKLNDSINLKVSDAKIIWENGLREKLQ